MSSKTNKKMFRRRIKQTFSPISVKQVFGNTHCTSLSVFVKESAAELNLGALSCSILLQNFSFSLSSTYQGQNLVSYLLNNLKICPVRFCVSCSLSVVFVWEEEDGF